MAQQNSGASQLAQLTRPGALNGGTDPRALYLKLFSGEMFKGFQYNAIARDLVMKRTLKNGKSLQFVYTGHTKAEFHTPGNSIMGNSDGAPPVAEKTITCDDLLISSAFVYELDETLAHYELRGEISKKIGYALAEKYDRLIFRAITRGARAASPIIPETKIPSPTLAPLLKRLPLGFGVPKIEIQIEVGPKLVTVSPPMSSIPNFF